MRWIIAALLLTAFVPKAGADWRDDVDRALVQAAASRRDLAVPADYTERDPFRLSLVSSWMQDPLAAPSALDGMAAALDPWGAAGSVSALETAFASLDLRITAPSGSGPEPPDSPRRHLGSWDKLPEPVRASVVVAVAGLDAASRQNRKAWAGLSKREREFIETRACSLLIEDPGIESLGVFELHQRERRHVALADSLFHLAARVDRGAVAIVSLLAGSAFDASLNRARFFTGETEDWILDRPKKETTRKGPGGTVEGAVAFWGESEIGAVVVGGPERNVYRGSFAVIVDPGGDDEYELLGAASGGPRFQSVLDLAGDDVYRGLGDGALGAGYFGAGGLADLSGDDRYEASRFSLGSGWFGLGMLMDGAGDDHYDADLASQGSAGFGVGILADAGGTDLYECRLMSQGFGYVAGLGALIDGAGNDVYLARAVYTDVLRYDDHSVTLCQGFGFGERPFASGGIGILHDLSGGDTYVADVYGQGSAYWWAAGALLDDAGPDHYQAQQYAQGAGVHLALGYLLEGGGNDAYASRSVAQGCGHDLGTGLLLDVSGDDLYSGADLSQGAGNANGNGLLVDLAGADGYLALNERTSQGYGNPRSETGSLGVLLDLAGRDLHSPAGADAAVWVGSERGVGFDAPSEGPVDAPARGVVVPVEERVFSLEELFMMASAGEPRFNEWQRRGVQELADAPGRSIPFLVMKLGTQIARERHTIKDIFRLIGPAGVEPLSRAVSAGDEDVRKTGAWILGEMRLAAAGPALMSLAADPSWRVRSAALNALGKLSGLGSDRALMAALGPLLSEAASDTAGPEFLAKDAAFAAGALGVRGAGPALCVALGHPSLRVRLAAEKALSTLGPETAPAVEASARRTAAGDGAAGLRRAPHLLAMAGAWGGRSGEEIFRLIESSLLWQEESVRAAARQALEDWAARAAAAPPARVRGPERERGFPATLSRMLEGLRADSSWTVRERRGR